PRAPPGGPPRPGNGEHAIGDRVPRGLPARPHPSHAAASGDAELPGRGARVHGGAGRAALARRPREPAPGGAHGRLATARRRRAQRERGAPECAPLRPAGVRADRAAVKRLAFFSPIPPAATGIADYAVDVLSLLAPRYAIAVFHDEASPERDRVPAGVGVHHHSEFAARQTAEPYDLAVYQMGDGPAPDFVYEPLVRVPGLLVLHDLVLHHARGRMFLDAPEARAYARDPGNAA